MKWVDYREKLGIGFNDSEKSAMLKNKTAIFLDLIKNSYSEENYRAYSLMVGEPLARYLDHPIIGVMNSILDQTVSTADFLSKYIAFYNSYNEANAVHNYNYSPVSKALIIQYIISALDELKIQYSIYEDDDGKYIFPKGIQEYDNELVSATLQWLAKYPNAEKAWGKALREYAENSPQNASDIADKFRKALEAFFQDFFHGEKSLENYKSQYGDFLRAKSIPKEIAANFETLLQAYTNYINNYAKHRDATSNKVLEYLMYQTGNIMRLLITLKQEEDSDAD